MTRFRKISRVLMTSRSLLLTLLLTLGTGVAHADNGLLSLGAGVTNDNLRDISYANNSNLNATKWKAWGGVRPIPFLAIEADYIDLGNQFATYPGGSTNLSYKAWAGYAVGFLPIPVPYLDIFGKVGLTRWLSSYSQTGFIASQGDSGTEFAYGAGAQVHIGNVGARLEYERFKITATDGVNLVSLTAFVNLF